jgi:broad specificity polyphosphatase/5'/3'-nucleotidase SurE
VVWGIPTVAFSLDSPENNSGLHGYCAAAKAAGGVIHQVLERGIPPSDLLNMNVYLRPWNDIKGFAFIATTWKSVLTQAGVHFIGSAMKLPGASWNKGLKLVLLPMGRYQRLPCNQI